MKRKSTTPLIVAVDDDIDFLKALRLLLEPDYAVECFSSGEGLIAQLDSLRPDAILLDVHMPSLDGIHLSKGIHAHPPFARVPIVFLTASTSDTDFIDAMDTGFTAFLNKPVTRKELHERLQEVLAGEG